MRKEIFRDISLSGKRPILKKNSQKIYTIFTEQIIFDLKKRKL